MVWLLEELHAQYHLEIVSFPKSDGSNADLRNPHPHGYTPALFHDGVLVTESGAITLYLTDLFQDSPIGIPVVDPLRGRYVTWLFYQVGLSEPLIYMKGTNVLHADAAMSRLYDSMMGHIEKTLAVSPYLLGQRFTAVDILYMSLFEQARALLGERDWMDSYIARGNGRPARQRALIKAG
jgi:glutathione S-transferase